MCPENEMYLAMLGMGKSPDYLTAMEVLERFVEHHLPGETEVIEKARWAKDLLHQRKSELPEPSPEFREMLSASLRHLGLNVPKGVAEVM